MATISTSPALRSHRNGESLFSKALAALARYSLYRDTLSELNQLSDRELADLSMSRGSIASIAREAAYGK